MSNETVSIILSVCGIAAVVGILIVLAALLLLRVLRSSLFGVASMTLKTLSESGEQTTAQDRRAPVDPRSGVEELRAKAQALDFDAAVARHGGESVVTQPLARPASVPPAVTPPPAPHESSRRRLREREDDEAGLMEGFLDDDNLP